jgi:DNA-binding HxlR family transcriptional regulator
MLRKSGVNNGLIVRHFDPGRVQTATLYHLTELGRTLTGPLDALERWIDLNWPTVEAARQGWSRLKK